MGTAYNVYLVDILNTIGSDDRRNETKAILKSYFDPIAKAAKIKDGSYVSFVTENPQAKPNELIVYFTTYGWHVVTEIGGNIRASPEGGLTVSDGKVTGSDVFADKEMDTRTLANLTFHELMHNKLNLGDAMHRFGGLARDTVDSDMRPSADNNRRMSAALQKAQPQWIGGFEQLKERGKPISVP